MTNRRSVKASSRSMPARDTTPSQAPRRGRPPKFGRPAQVVAVTLPEEVLAALRSVHHDLGWAIVKLTEPILHDGRRPARPARRLAELVHLPGGRALIVVDPRVFKDLRGVSTIPLADGRAFLALDPGAGVADLELAIIDRLDAGRAQTAARERLAELLAILRGWRRNAHLAFRVKSIIVVEGGAGVERGPLAPIGVKAGVKPEVEAARRRPRGSAT